MVASHPGGSGNIPSSLNRVKLGHLGLTGMVCQANQRPVIILLSPLTCSVRFVRSFVRSFVRLFVCSFVLSFILLFVCLFACFLLC